MRGMTVERCSSHATFLRKPCRSCPSSVLFRGSQIVELWLVRNQQQSQKPALSLHRQTEPHVMKRRSALGQRNQPLPESATSLIETAKYFRNIAHQRRSNGEPSPFLSADLHGQTEGCCMAASTHRLPTFRPDGDSQASSQRQSSIALEGAPTLFPS